MSKVAFKVAVRVRPTNPVDMVRRKFFFSGKFLDISIKRSSLQDDLLVRVENSTTLVFGSNNCRAGDKHSRRRRLRKKLRMEFDAVFDEDASNTDIFESCAKSMVKPLLRGVNCSVFAYGATTTGKTFTVMGRNDTPGIAALTIREIFAEIKALDASYRCRLRVVFFEIVNGAVIDLLSDERPKTFRLCESQRSVSVQGIKLKAVEGEDELLALLTQGNKKRSQRSSDVFDESSRSHAILQVHVEMTSKKTGDRQTTLLSMVDLAGSKRTRRHSTVRKDDTNVNKSLLSLGHCIKNLAHGCRHVPYRDSTLSRVLKSSLDGRGNTLMIANISPSISAYEDTLNTLRYANRAKNIPNVLRYDVNDAVVDGDSHVLRLLNEQISRVVELKSKIEEFKDVYHDVM